MKNLTPYFNLKIATKAWIIAFLVIILPVMNTAQTNVAINDITHVYYGGDGNIDKASYFQNGFGSLSEGWLWTHHISLDEYEHYVETKRDNNAIYFVKYNYGLVDSVTLKIDISNSIILKTVNGISTVISHPILATVNSLEQLTAEEAALINQQEDEANRAYKLTKPVTDANLNAIMEWIGKETSRRSVAFCWKDTYARNTYNNQTECENAEKGECVRLGLLWYVKCKEGYETSVVPHCLMICPDAADVGAGAQNVKVDCGLICALNTDECASGVSEMVFAPIMMAMNIISFGLTGAAKNAAQNAVKQSALGGAAATAGAEITETALSANWFKLLDAIDASEKIISPAIDAKDQFEYLLNTVDNLATEINRWNESFEFNFREYTHYAIESEINNRFSDPDDRSFIKQAYGQYQLTAMLEADGWRIAKAVMSAASIEPTGIISTINAFAHPVCNLVATPFPDIRIIPKSERYKVYPEVKFYGHNNVSLAQAKNIAKANSWTLANEAEIRNAWNVGQLDVYAFGMLSNGKFAVPTQSDHSNFKKGTNINATGGNQGFFYTVGLHEKELPPPTPIISPYVNFAKFHIQDNLHHRAMISGDQANGRIYHQYANNRKNAEWVFISIGDGYYNIVDVKHNLALVAGAPANNNVYHQLSGNLDNAKWKLESLGDGSFHITDKLSNKSLVAGTSYDGNIYHQTPQGRVNATWKLILVENENGIRPSEYTPPLSYALFQIEDNLHHKAIIAGDNASGRTYHQDANGRTNARWIFKSTGDGYYHIIDSKHKLAIVAGDSANNWIYHQSPNGRDNAKWKLEPVGNGSFHITDKKHGRSLVAGTGYDGNIYHQTPQGRLNASWKLTVVGNSNGLKPSEIK